MPEKKTTRVLMTGAGAPGAAGILHCLKQEPLLEIITADANPDAVGKYLSSSFETIPSATDSQFATTILDLCKRKSIDIVLPLVTKELVPLALLQKDFEGAGIKLPLSPIASLEIANNKSMLYQFLEWRGIPVPAFKVAETVEQFRSAFESLGYPRDPVCFKPSVSNGSRGFRVINSKVNELDLLFNHKPGSTFITPNDIIRILSSGPFPELLVSEYLPGEEYSVDCFASHGESKLIIPRTRKRMINGISVEGEFINDEKIVSYCRKIISELKLHGNIGIQVKRSSSGEALILEINPRVQGTISAALGAGINLPLLAIKQELGWSIRPEELDVRWGTRFSRYWNEVFY